MTEFLNVDREAMFQEIVDRGRTEGIVDQDAFHELAEEVVMEHLNVGEIDEDSSTVGWVEQMKGRWPEYREALGLDTARPQL